MLERLTIAQIDQVEPPRAWGFAYFLQPDLDRPVGMSSTDEMKRVRIRHNRSRSQIQIGGDAIPVEHDPLGRGCDAIMALIQCRQPGKDRIIVVGHL